LHKRLSHVYPIQTKKIVNPENTQLPSIKHTVSEFLKNNMTTPEINKEYSKINFDMQKMPSLD
jgi:hypothetical protein